MASLAGARRAAGAVLGSYAQIVIARAPIAGALLLVATALDGPTGLGGLAALAGAALLARALALPEGTLGDGPAGYNALFSGLAVGHLFGAGIGALALAAAWGGVTVLLASAFVATAGKALGLPALTVPFLIATYALILAAPSLGLTPRAPAPSAVAPDGPLATALAGLGELVFVPRVAAGLLVLAALVVGSRVAFLLGAAGALALAPFLRQLTLPPGTAAPLLFNGVLAALALGGTWFVPGPASFALAAAGAALSALVTLALQRSLAFWGLPVLVLPFNLVVLIVLCAMRQRTRDRFPKAVDFAPGSPERNLHYYLTRIARAAAGTGMPIGLPFRGAWLCTQGIDGSLTHRGPWRHAFDFEVAGPDGRFHAAGARPDDQASYHCYRLPVLAAADGTVVKVEHDVPDNPVGGMDLERNWGNVVVLYHGPGLYSLVAHLAPRSATVREGQAVRRGDVIGLCGSSGRSPRPHLHFQLQATPTLGAPTRPVVFDAGVLTSGAAPRLVTGFVPREGEIWKSPDPDRELADRLVFAPGTGAAYRVNGHLERLSSEVDPFGQTLLRSDRGGVLFFTRTAAQLTILDVQAPADSILHLLRAALGRVPLTADPSVCWRDHLPPAFGARRPWIFLRETVAPFLSGTGAPMEYRLRREANQLVIAGRSGRSRPGGRRAVMSWAVLRSGGWPAAVELDPGRGLPSRAELIPPASGVAAPPLPEGRVIHLPPRARPSQWRGNGV